MLCGDGFGAGVTRPMECGDLGLGGHTSSLQDNKDQSGSYQSSDSEFYWPPLML